MLYFLGLRDDIISADWNWLRSFQFQTPGMSGAALRHGRGLSVARILFVDDEPNILQGLERALRPMRDEWAMAFVTSGAEALVDLSANPADVIVTDLRMPQMNGIEFLSRVAAVAPDTVRIILTGHADVEVAIAAVNEGRVFRFLVKPVPPEVLVGTLRAGIEQYRLVMGERVLLSKTLHGTIRVLTDILSMASPMAFSRAARLQRTVRYLVQKLGLPRPWLFEMAAMLSQLGCLMLPVEILEKCQAGQDLTEDEQRLFNRHPQMARRLLGHIPRLEVVVAMIARQHEPAGGQDTATPPRERNPALLGAQILKVALAYDELIGRGALPSAAIQRLRQRPADCDPALVAALEGVQNVAAPMRLEVLRVADLHIGMIVAQNVYTKKMALIIRQGQTINEPVLARLRHFAAQVGVLEPIRVLVPQACPSVSAAQTCTAMAEAF